MRKLTMFVLRLLALSMLAMPAFAQGGEPPRAATNWVAITSGFRHGIGRAVRSRLGQASPPQPAKAWPAIPQPVPEFSSR